MIQQDQPPISSLQSPPIGESGPLQGTPDLPEEVPGLESLEAPEDPGEVSNYHPIHDLRSEQSEDCI